MFFVYLRRELRLADAAGDLHLPGPGHRDRPGHHRDGRLRWRGPGAGRGAALPVRGGHRHHRHQGAGSQLGRAVRFRVRGRTGTGTGARPTRPAPGTKFSRSVLLNRALGPISSTSVTSISGLHGVAAAGGALALTDLSISGTVPNVSASGGGGGFAGGDGTGGGGGGGFASSFSTNTFTVNGTQISAGEVGPLSSSKITSGRTFTTADATERGRHRL